MTTADAAEFVVELISQLFHADVLITELAERIEALEAENERLRTAPLLDPMDVRIHGGINTDGPT